jgi:hypothetical protein
MTPPCLRSSLAGTAKGCTGTGCRAPRHQSASTRRSSQALPAAMVCHPCRTQTSPGGCRCRPSHFPGSRPSSPPTDGGCPLTWGRLRPSLSPLRSHFHLCTSARSSRPPLLSSHLGYLPSNELHAFSHLPSLTMPPLTHSTNFSYSLSTPPLAPTMPGLWVPFCGGFWRVPFPQSLQPWTPTCSPWPGAARLLLSALALVDRLQPTVSVTPVHWGCVRALERGSPPPTRHWPQLSHLATGLLADEDKVVFGIVLFSFVHLLRLSETRGFVFHPHTTSVSIPAAKRGGVAWRPVSPTLVPWLEFLAQSSRAPRSQSLFLPFFKRLTASTDSTSTWHAVRRGGAATLAMLGVLPDRLWSWGRWASPSSAEPYIDMQTHIAPPPADILLPQPSGPPVRISTTSLWPRYLFGECGAAAAPVEPASPGAGPSPPPARLVRAAAAGPSAGTSSSPRRGRGRPPGAGAGRLGQRRPVARGLHVRHPLEEGSHPPKPSPTPRPRRKRSRSH